MTGFGRAEKSAGNWKCRVEIRSVNNRFLEVRLRVPAGLGYYEDALKERVKSRCIRGKFDCTIHLIAEQGNSQPLRLNKPLARGYGDLVNEFNSLLGLEVQITLRDLIEIKDLVVAQSWEEDHEAVEALLNDSLDLALGGLCEMRAGEGAALETVLLQMIAQLRELQERIIPLTAGLPEQMAKRLRENLARLMNPGEPTDERILQEIAIFADRCDISEETARFSAHLEAGEKMIEAEGAVGRKFEFLLQEMNREANTLTAKSNNAEVSALVIEMKGVLEQMREQIQNIE